jgi:protein-S-isoprenylcysteine O-methyltransferase Ste14
VVSAQSKHGGANVRFPPPLVFLGLIGVGVALQHWVWPLTLPLALWPRIVAGVVVALGGLGMAVAARAWFTRTGQDPAPWRPSPQLLVQGIYRYTRNPMYIGLTLLELGIGIALGNGWIATLAPIGLVIVHFLAVLPEEAYLTDKFGESYLAYKSSVSRYL